MSDIKFTPEKIAELRAIASRVKSLPWSACDDGKCPCKTIMAADYPIAKISSGDWGDDYPTIRLEGGPLDTKAVAVMEQITYGHIPEELALANILYFVSAANTLPDALDEIERLNACIPVSEVPCCKCHGEVIEFTVPNELWNAVMRPDGCETDQEYLCFDCWNKELLAVLKALINDVY